MERGAAQKRILYLSNIEVPYRARFFDALSERCALTVLYEREVSSNRDAAWTGSERGSYSRAYLGGIPVGTENAFSLKILRHITGGYDTVIVGCYNSPVQMLAMLAMRLCRIRFLINVDGEAFLNGRGPKAWLKRFFLKGAAGYLAAGEKAAESLRSVAGGKPVTTYPFSSLSDAQLAANSQNAQDSRGDTVLVVGQFYDYKGLDVALEAARMDAGFSYRFVGMGKRTELFRTQYQTDSLPNVQLIPFLQKKELEEEYRQCSMLVLPSRQECWGLVVNEAASFGTPIVSTWGSGAAVEFLSDAYPQYLAQPGDPASLLACIQQLRAQEDRAAYSDYLKKKASAYSIEKSVQAHLRAIGAGEQESE